MISSVGLIFVSSVSCSRCNFSIRQSGEKVISKSRLSKRLPHYISGKLYTSHPSSLALTHTSLSSPSSCYPEEIEHNVISHMVLKKKHCWAQVMKGKPKMRANEQLCHYLPISLSPHCEFHAANSSLCPCSDLWSRFGYRRGVVRLGGTPSSLQSSPVRNLQALELNCCRVPLRSFV